jgi:hypothetical protein
MATTTSARESTLSILTLSRDSAGTVRMNCRRLLKTNSRRPAGFVTFLSRSRQSSQQFCRLPISFWAGVQATPSLAPASKRPSPLLLLPNPALKYSVMIPKPCVPQGQRRTERLRNPIARPRAAIARSQLRSLVPGSHNSGRQLTREPFAISAVGVSF